MKKFKDGNLIEVAKEAKIYIEKNHPEIAINFQNIVKEPIDEILITQSHFMPMPKKPIYDPNQEENVFDLAAVVLSKFLIGAGFSDSVGIPIEVSRGDDDINGDDRQSKIATYKLLSPLYP